MRPVLFALVMIGVSALPSTEATAQYYPWCSVYNDKGIRNCGFVSFAQCMANVHGIGGACELNPWAVTPKIRASGRTRHHR
jgi:hypothetical protein